MLCSGLVTYRPHTHSHTQTYTPRTQRLDWIRPNFREWERLDTEGFLYGPQHPLGPPAHFIAPSRHGSNVQVHPRLATSLRHTTVYLDPWGVGLAPVTS